jgi:hypothetical protein
MIACDRHARSEGSLGDAETFLTLTSHKEVDEVTGYPKVLLKIDLCSGCTAELVEWMKTGEPPSRFLTQIRQMEEVK